MKDPTILTFPGPVPGKTVAIFAGIHGNEIGGIFALRQLIDDLQTGKIILEKGTLHLAFANLAGIARGIRQTDLNMNRAFHSDGNKLPEADRSSYERLRALELQPLLDQSEALLDLHSTLTESSPFIICETHSFGIARLLPFSLISTGWDNVHGGSTDAYMNAQGKIGICVECGQHEDPEAKERARLSIAIFLNAMGLIDTEEKGGFSTQRRIHAKTIYKVVSSFALSSVERPEFARLKQDELIGVDGAVPILAPTDSILIFPRKTATIGEEAFVLGEEQVL